MKQLQYSSPDLSIWMLGNFSRLFLSSAGVMTLTKVNIFNKKILSEILYGIKWFGYRSGPTVSQSWSGYRLFEKGYQQTTKFTSVNPLRATYNLQQTTISNFAAFSKITIKAWYFMRIVCQHTILMKMKYHSFFLSKIRKDVAKFVVCCSCDWRFKR